MFDKIPIKVQSRMHELEEVDARERLNGKPRLQRLRQIPPHTGRFLAILAASAPEGVMLEIGTSAGYSSLWLSLACKQYGRKLTTFEILPEKITLAQETFRKAEVEDMVELVQGDARSHIQEYDEIAFCFLDAEKDEYLEFYELVVPRLAHGGLLLVDNVTSHQQAVQPMLDKAMNEKNLDSIIVPVGQGVLVSRRI